MHRGTRGGFGTSGEGEGAAADRFSIRREYECKILLVRMESLTLWGKSKKQIRDVWIGISDTRISTDGTYRMLVNPDIFRRGYS